MNTLNKHQVVRAAYSLRDLGRASSALVFLEEEMQEADSARAHMRRHYCYETAAITAYMRPFSSAHGIVQRLTIEPWGSATDDEKRPLSLADIGMSLTPNELALHHRLKTLRDRAVAHSDFEHMEFKLHQIPLSDPEDEERTMMPWPEFPEGPVLLSTEERQAMDALVGKLMQGLVRAIIESTQNYEQGLVISGGRLLDLPPLN